MNIEKFNRAKEIQDNLKALKEALNKFNSETVTGLSYIYKSVMIFGTRSIPLPNNIIEDIKLIIIKEINKLENEFKSI